MKVNSFSISQKKVFICSLFLTLSYTVLFPADKLNIKEILLFLTLFIGYFKLNIRISFLTTFSIIYTLFSVLYSIFLKNSITDVLSFGYVWLFLLLLPIINKYKCNILTPFLFCTYIIALVIDFIAICDIVGIVSIFENPLAIFFKDMNELQGLGKGVLATFGYSIFYKSSPLIIISICYFLSKSKYLFSLPLCLSMLFCGTRANLFITIMCLVLIPLIYERNKHIKLSFIIIVFICALIFMPSLINKIIELNDLKAHKGDNFKIEDTIIIFDMFKMNPNKIFFGFGVGSSFLSSRGEMLSTFELSYFDYFRQVGIVGISLFLIFLVTPLFTLLKYKKWLLVGYVSYLAVAFTNPLLVNSTAFIVYLLVYSVYFNYKRKRFIKK